MQIQYMMLFFEIFRRFWGIYFLENSEYMLQGMINKQIVWLITKLSCGVNVVYNVSLCTSLMTYLIRFINDINDQISFGGNMIT